MSDFDGDIVFTTNSQEMIDGAIGGFPISYSKKIAPKAGITEKQLQASDMNGMHSKIGFITNCSSSVYAMMVGLDKRSKQYKELLRRSKLFRYFQGENIDKAKNGSAKEMPEEWFNYTKITDDMDKEEAEMYKFYNSLLIEKRPYFFRYIYDHYNKRFLREVECYDNTCQRKFKFGFKGLLAMPEEEISEEMLSLKKDYYKYSYFIFSPSIMNKICWHMEKNIKEYKESSKKDNFDYKILMSNIPLEAKKIEQMDAIIEDYRKAQKKHLIFENEDDSLNEKDIYSKHLYNKAIDEISTDEQELASLAIYCTYEMRKSQREIAWNLFGEGIYKNLLQNRMFDKIEIPVEDDCGNILYLWKRYSLKIFDVFKEIGDQNAE